MQGRPPNTITLHYLRFPKKIVPIHSFSLLEYTITATIRHKEGEKRKIQQTINKIDEQIAPIKDITLNNR